LEIEYAAQELPCFTVGSHRDLDIAQTAPTRKLWTTGASSALYEAMGVADEAG
jgi:hypothetical protein